MKQFPGKILIVEKGSWGEWCPTGKTDKAVSLLNRIAHTVLVASFRFFFLLIKVKIWNSINYALGNHFYISSGGKSSSHLAEASNFDQECGRRMFFRGQEPRSKSGTKAQREQHWKLFSWFVLRYLKVICVIPLFLRNMDSLSGYWIYEVFTHH